MRDTFLANLAKTGLARAIVLAAMLAAWPLASTRAADKDRPTPSGLPVPRYVSLKFDIVNARSAPGDDSRLLWVYHARGLPVQVVAEHEEWRRICDPEHGLAWVHERTTNLRRTVLRLKPEPLALHAGPDGKSPVRAWLAGRALAQFDRCANDGWCKLTAGRVSGWAPAGEVWGTAEEPQCR